MNFYKILFVIFSLFFWNFPLSAQNSGDFVGDHTLGYVEPQSDDTITWSSGWAAYSKIEKKISCISVVWGGIKKEAIRGAFEFVTPLHLKNFFQNFTQIRRYEENTENNLSAINEALAKIDRECFKKPKETTQQVESQPHQAEPAIQFKAADIMNTLISVDERTISMFFTLLDLSQITGIESTALFMEIKRIDRALNDQGTSFSSLIEKVETLTKRTEITSAQKAVLLDFFLEQSGIDSLLFKNSPLAAERELELELELELEKYIKYSYFHYCHYPGSLTTQKITSSNSNPQEACTAKGMEAGKSHPKQHTCENERGKITKIVYSPLSQEEACKE